MASDERTLLIVDDEPDLREVLQHSLKELGVQFVMASDGKQALEIMQQREVHAVLCDIKMPGKDGIQLLAEVRAAMMDVPFVFLTGFGSKEHMLEALRLGATDFLDKPCSKEELTEVVSRALEIGAKESEIAEGKRKIMTHTSANASQDMAKLESKKKQISLLKVVNNSKRHKG